MISSKRLTTISVHLLYYDCEVWRMSVNMEFSNVPFNIGSNNMGYDTYHI